MHTAISQQLQDNIWKDNQVWISRQFGINALSKFLDLGDSKFFSKGTETRKYIVSDA